jgi:hypothetical protein
VQVLVSHCFGAAKAAQFLDKEDPGYTTGRLPEIN